MVMVQPERPEAIRLFYLMGLRFSEFKVLEVRRAEGAIVVPQVVRTTETAEAAELS